jgi:ADP-ribose pyrophosphatase YjhB (NUDIX family)
MIRIRVGVAVVQEDRGRIPIRVLLVPHYDTDVGPVQWCIPGGRLELGELLEEAAAREFEEETGLQVEVGDLLHVSEVILPERPYHSVTLTYSGWILGGTPRPEADNPYGRKVPRWLSASELETLEYHPREAVEKALSDRDCGVRHFSRNGK